MCLAGLQYGNGAIWISYRSFLPLHPNSGPQRLDISSAVPIRLCSDPLVSTIQRPRDDGTVAWFPRWPSKPNGISWITRWTNGEQPTGNYSRPQSHPLGWNLNRRWIERRTSLGHRRPGLPYIVAVVSSASDGAGSTGFFTQITTSAYNQIETWVKGDDASTPGLAVLNTTTGRPISATAQAYPGPVADLREQYVNITPDSLNISVSTPNWFIHSGSGNDAIAASSGINVLDGGTGSNFLTGGSGTDTFFVDDRGPTADIWSTVSGFHAGDAATIWGVTPQDFSLTWVDGQGAAGYTGLTLHATSAGKPTASLTLAGFSQADLTSGRLSVSFGTVGGSAYMYVHGNS